MTGAGGKGGRGRKVGFFSDFGLFCLFKGPV